ncbi:MAG: carbohydrate-binding domain-containing protein [Clostridia bacterium]|nr:carbohydrate-binding domain-containing protein [Clostridia bacterium]
MKKFFSLLITATILLTICSCQTQDPLENIDNDISNKNQLNSEQTEIAENSTDKEMFSDRDLRSEYSDGILIELNGDTAICDSDSVRIDDSQIVICEEGTYVITGTLDDGMIIVNAKDTEKIQIVLDGSSVTSKTSASLYILEADKVFVTLAAGTENFLSNGGEFIAIDENNIDAVVFSKQDLTFNGTGTLSVSSPAGHGIVSKDDLVFTGGTFNVTASAHGIDANDSIRATNSLFNITSGKDGFHSENNEDETLGFVYIKDGNFNITADGDGISAGVYMQIVDGNFNIVSGGGSVNGEEHSSGMFGGFGGPMGGRSQQSSSESETETVSTKALKARGTLTIENGTFTLNSADDAVHSNTSITVNDGSYIISTGDDAFHADETLTVKNGEITVTESYEGLEGLDIEVSGGKINIVSSDDGLNAAGGTDSSGFGGQFGGDMFGGGRGPGGGGRGGPGGMNGSSDGSIVISGGELYINASGDGIDANGTLEITGGYTVVCGPTMIDTATLDYDISAIISGGTFIGTGASNMAQTFSRSEQGVIAVSVGSQKAETQIKLEDMSGNVIIDYSPALSFQVVILSSPDIVSGQTYKITVGESSAEFEAN